MPGKHRKDPDEQAKEQELREEYEARQEGEVTEGDEPDLPHVPPFSRS